MKFEILRQKILNNIPSASGIVRHREHYYVVGDDSPYLFKLDENFETIDQFPIHGVTEGVDNEIIPKKDKPDFEALEMISDYEIIGFGSGSRSPERDVFVSIMIGESVTTEQTVITNFYEALKKTEVMENSELNVEAAAFKDEVLYLFNRRKNIIFSLNYPEFLNFIRNKFLLMDLRFQEFSLPRINGIEAGFSGATISRNGTLLVTAAVEDTDNAYDDGEVMGSFIGVALPEEDGRFGEINWGRLNEDDPSLKIESVTILRETTESNLHIVVVSDSDGGDSLIIEGNLKF